MGPILIIALWIFEASFRSNAKAQREIDRLSPNSSLEILYDNGSPSNAVPRMQLHGAVGEFYYIFVRNRGSQTLFDVSVRALEGKFSQYVFALAQGVRYNKSLKPIVIFEIPELHPDAPERVGLFGLDYHAGGGNPDDLYNNIQRFTLEARARDTKAIRVEFEFDPNARPMVRDIG